MIRRLHSNPPKCNNARPQGYVPPVDRRPLHKRLTQDERERIAAIAAKIPDRKDNLKPIELIPVRQPYATRLIDRTLHLAGVSKRKWNQPRRNGRVAAISSALAFSLKKKDSEFYSYPKIARILGRKDHTTIIYAVEHWPRFAQKYPDVAEIINQAELDAR